MRGANYAADDILRLCDPHRRVRMSHHLIFAIVFAEEIYALAGTGEKPLRPPEQLGCRLRLMRTNSAYKDAYYLDGGSRVGWTALIRYFTTTLATAEHQCLIEY